MPLSIQPRPATEQPQARAAWRPMMLLAALMLAGCSSTTFEEPRNTVEFALPEEAPYGDEGDPPVMTLEVQPLQLEFLTDRDSEPLPDAMVGPITIAGEPLAVALDLLLANTDVAYLIENSTRETADTDLAQTEVLLRLPQPRPLREVVETISQSTGLNYIYRDGLLRLQPTRDYILKVPRLGEDFDFSESVSAMGAENVEYDETSGIVTFTANRQAADRIRRFVETFWETRDQIVYDTYVLEVTLTNSKNIGINWNQLDFIDVLGSEITLGTSFVGDTAGGLVLTAVGESNRFAVDAVLGFLSTQGDVRTLSKPTVTILNGGEATLRVGQSQEYISRIQRSTDDITGETTVTVETDEADTAIELELTGNYTNGVVYTEVNVNIEETLGFNSFTTGGEDAVTLDLPETSEREIETAGQIRPGDTLVVGGLIREVANDGRTGTTLFNIPLSKSQEDTRVELVVLLRPRVIQYRPADSRTLAGLRGMTPVALEAPAYFGLDK